MFLRSHRRSKDGKQHSYWSLVETVRTPDGPRQRRLCYLGELNDSAHSRWLKTIEVFNAEGESTQLKLFPSGVEPPENDLDVARVLLKKVDFGESPRRINQTGARLHQRGADANRHQVGLRLLAAVPDGPQ